MYKNLTLVLVGLELMVLAHYEEVNNIGATTQGPFLTHLYNIPLKQIVDRMQNMFASLHCFTVKSTNYPSPQLP